MPLLMPLLRLVIEPTDETYSSREKRRAYISPDVLRTYKIPAGSWVALSSGKVYEVLQLWPRASADAEGKYIWDTYIGAAYV
jgi:hypothetical protein